MLYKTIRKGKGNENETDSFEAFTNSEGNGMEYVIYYNALG